MIPTLIQIGPVAIHSFGLLLVLAFLSAWRLLALRLEEAGENPELAERMVFWGAVGGIIGGRVFYLVSFPQEFIHDPLGAVFSGAGFVFYGGFLGGLIGVWLLLRKEKRPFWRFSDIVAPALAVGYAVGRIGCQLSGDGDYGVESAVPWAMSYARGVVPTEAGMLVHPAPVYETLLSLAIAMILLKLEKRGGFPRPGQLFGVYLILSASARFFVEYVRIEPRVFMNLTQAQIEGVVLVFLGTGLIFFSGLFLKSAPKTVNDGVHGV